MVKKLKVGIVVPIYKVEKYLSQCINSILSQSYADFQLVLVDDGSPDKCPQICDDYALKDSRIKVIHKKNGGLVSAWLAGLSVVDRDITFVVFIDSDDWISKKYLEILVNVQSKNNADVVVTQLRNVYPDGSTLQKKYNIKVDYYDRSKIKEELYPILLNAGDFQKKAISCSRCGKLIRKQLLLNNIKYVDEKTTYEEDLNIMLPVSIDAQGIELVLNEECLYLNRANPDSMTHAYDRRMRDSIEYVYNSIDQIIMDKEVKKIFRNQALAEYLAASVQYYKNELLNPNGIKEINRNISLYCRKNRRLDKSIRVVEWKNYRKLNVIIIHVLKRYDSFISILITEILRLLKIVKFKKLRSQSNINERG